MQVFFQSKVWCFVSAHPEQCEQLPRTMLTAKKKWASHQQNTNSGIPLHIKEEDTVCGSEEILDAWITVSLGTLDWEV